MTLTADTRVESITAALKGHYAQTFRAHGPSSRGVDWGREEDVFLRYDKMLAVIPPTLATSGEPICLLDVGCGYGGLYERAKTNRLRLDYCGIDVVPEMIAHARQSAPAVRFECADIFNWSPAEQFDYVVCSGILTQKLATSIKEMDRYAQLLIKRMFALARCGIAFNVMTTHVNFMAGNLYYRNPVELLAWCLTEVSDRIRLDHAYPLYEYTVYLFRDSRP